MKIERDGIFKAIKYKLSLVMIMAVFLLLLNYFGFELRKNTETIIVLIILVWWLKQIFYITALNFHDYEFIENLETQRNKLSKQEFKQLTKVLRENFESDYPKISLYNSWVTVISGISIYIAAPIFLIYVNLN